MRLSNRAKTCAAQCLKLMDNGYVKMGPMRTFGAVMIGEVHRRCVNRRQKGSGFALKRGFSCFSKQRTEVCLLAVVRYEVGINLRFLSVFKTKPNFDEMERPGVIGTMYVQVYTSVLHTNYPPTTSTMISVIITKV